MGHNLDLVLQNLVQGPLEVLGVTMGEVIKSESGLLVIVGVPSYLQRV